MFYLLDRFRQIALISETVRTDCRHERACGLKGGSPLSSRGQAIGRPTGTMHRTDGLWSRGDGLSD